MKRNKFLYRLIRKCKKFTIIIQEYLKFVYPYNNDSTIQSPKTKLKIKRANSNMKCKNMQNCQLLVYVSKIQKTAQIFIYYFKDNAHVQNQ